MLSHVTTGATVVARARALYDAVLAPLDVDLKFGGDDHAGYGPVATPTPMFWVLLPFNDEPATVGNGTHVAFLAPSRKAVDALHRLALEHGGKDEDAAGLRRHYHEHYYGAYVRGLDGNKLQACCHQPE